MSSHYLIFLFLLIPLISNTNIGILSTAHHIGECQYFQTTGVCSLSKRQNYESYYKCSETIDSMITGYCKCKDNWRTPDFGCGHKPVNCESECRKCHGWRATMDCSPYASRDPKGDLSCSEEVPSASSGYCLCEDGRRTAFSDCHHTPFTCYQECAKLSRRRCPIFNSTLYSSTATGCTGIMELQNRANEEVSVFIVNAKGIDSYLASIPKGGSYKISKFCAPLSIRVYATTTETLLFQQIVKKLSSYSFPITNCYSEHIPIHKNTFTSVESANMKFEMKWGGVRGVSQPLSEETDLTFSMLQPLSSILVAYNQSFTWKRSTECPHCKMVLQHSSILCPRCQDYLQSTTSTCPLCGGYGRIPTDGHYSCSHCHNEHVIEETISEARLIPEGAPEGYRITFEKGGNHLPFSHASNVIYTLHYSVPQGYSIQNQDLVYDFKFTVKESKIPREYSLLTPLGRNVTFFYGGNALESEAFQVIEGEGLPIMGKSVKCNQFVVTGSSNANDRRNRSCNERIPQYLNGYCECDGRKVYYNQRARVGGLISCYHANLCGHLSRGNLVIRYSIKDMFDNFS